MIYPKDELIRSLLRHLDIAADLGRALPEDYLLQELRNEGRPHLKLEEMNGVLADLAKDSLVQVAPRIPGTKPQWRITGTGRNIYAQSMS